MSDSQVPEAWVRLSSYDKSEYGAGSTMSRLIATHRRIGCAFKPLFLEIMVAPGFLTRQEREMIAAMAAAAQDCHY